MSIGLESKYTKKIRGQYTKYYLSTDHGSQEENKRRTASNYCKTTEQRKVRSTLQTQTHTYVLVMPNDEQHAHALEEYSFP